MPIVNLEPLTNLWEVRTQADMLENMQKSLWPRENLNLEPSCGDMTPQQVCKSKKSQSLSSKSKKEDEQYDNIFGTVSEG